MSKMDRKNLIVLLKKVESAISTRDLNRLKKMELWAWIPGWKNRYMASTWGRLRSFTQRGGGRILNLSPQKNNYFKVGLCRKNGTLENCLVHRLILLTFVGPPPTKHEAAHLDGIRTNNQIWNLKWKTKSQNQMDRFTHGTACDGASNYLAKFGDRVARELILRYQSGESMSELGKIYNLSSGGIHGIVTGKSWKYIHKEIEQCRKELIESN